MASLANPGRAAARPVARDLMVRDHNLEMWCFVETIAFALVCMAERRLARSGWMVPKPHVSDGSQGGTGTPRLRNSLVPVVGAHWPVNGPWWKWIIIDPSI